MKYCAHCKRLNSGDPVFCQYCSHSFNVRICRGCGHMNPTDALACRRCGRTNLSEPSGSSSIWPKVLKMLFWMALVFLAINFIKAMLMNLQAFASLAIVIGLFALAYGFLPEIVKNLIRGMVKGLKGLFIKKEDNI